MKKEALGTLKMLSRKRDRRKAVEELVGVEMRARGRAVPEALGHAEREAYQAEPGEVGNGHYTRDLTGAMGTLEGVRICRTGGGGPVLSSPTSG